MSASAPCPRHHDAGATLVEILVAMTVFGVISTLLLGLGLATSRAHDDIRALGTVGEEARLGMERMTRELRQAEAVVAAELPETGAPTTSLTVWIDLDGDRCIRTTAPKDTDVEQITYRWSPDTRELTMTASGSDSPLLATTVTSFTLELDSSSWQYDTSGPNGKPDGITTWQEIDASSIGDHNSAHFSQVEYRNIDMVGLTVTTEEDGHAVTYTTRVDLRNQHPNEVPKTC